MTPLFVPLGTIDIWALCHSAYAHQHRLGKAVDGVRRLPIIDGKWKNPEAKAIKNLDLMITRAKKLIAQAPELTMARARLEMLDPGAATPWQPGVEGEIEAHIGIVTNRAAHLYAAGAAYTVGWGEAVLSTVGPRGKRSSANFGDTPRLHLVLTLNRSDPLHIHEPEALEAVS